MFVYRITKTKERAKDLSGTGAFRAGGRWNSRGTYLLYTSQNSSLALLETLVHLDETELPQNLFITKIEIDDKPPVFELKSTAYPKNWMEMENTQTKIAGDRFIKQQKYVAMKVRSAVNPTEYNFLLNPLHPHFTKYVKIVSVTPLQADGRLLS